MSPAVSVPWFLLGEGVGADHHDVDLVDPGLHRPLEAPAVQHQADVGGTQVPRARAAMTASASAIWGTRLGLTKLTASIRRMPACSGTLDELDLGRGGQQRGVRLEAVAGRDLYDRDLGELAVICSALLDSFLPADQAGTVNGNSVPLSGTLPIGVPIATHNERKVPPQ